MENWKKIKNELNNELSKMNEEEYLLFIKNSFKKNVLNKKIKIADLQPIDISDLKNTKKDKAA